MAIKLSKNYRFNVTSIELTAEHFNLINLNMTDDTTAETTITLPATISSSGVKLYRGGNLLHGGNSFTLAELNTEQITLVIVTTANYRGFKFTVTVGDNTPEEHSFNPAIDPLGDDTYFTFGSINDEFLQGGNDRDVLIGGDGVDTLYGGNGNDALDGGNGNDILIGGEGIDTLYGGSGSDTLIGGEGIDNAVYTDSNHSVTVSLNIGTDRQVSNGYARGDSLNGIENLVGSSHGDRLTGSSGENVLSGYHGDDILYGLGGNDILIGGQGNDTLHGGGDDDSLRGDSGRDSLRGGDGNDRLDGGSGNDDLYGEEGRDTFVFAHGGGHDTVHDFRVGSDHLNLNTRDPVEVEFREEGGKNWIVFKLSQTDSIKIEGNISTDFESVLAGSSTRVTTLIQDKNGNTTLGNTIVVGTRSHDIINGDEGVDHLYGSGGNDHLRGGAGNDILRGGAGNDTLRGDDNDDTLDGGSGADILFGGAGRDTFVFGYGHGYGNIIADFKVDIDHLKFTADQAVKIEYLDNDWIEFKHQQGYAQPGSIRIKGDEDTDLNSVLVGSPVPITLIQDDIQDDTTDLIYVGIETTDTVYGKSGVDTLYGNGGDDILFGGDNNDKLYGGENNDILIGDAGDDTLNGGDGNDYLDGGDGADTLNGGDGSDSVGYSYSSVGVTVSLRVDGEMQDSAGDASGDMLYSIENLYGSAHRDILTGSIGNNKLYGGAGNDTLEGGNGHDTLEGGEGNDELYGGRGRDTFVFGHGDGEDTVHDVFRVDYDHLQLVTDEDVNVKYSDYFIVFELSETDSIKILGNRQTDLKSVIAESSMPITLVKDNTDDDNTDDIVSVGTSDDDILNGRNGDDILTGRAGDDTLNGGEGVDTLWGGEDDDTLNGGEGVDTLNGGEGVDTLNGGAGDDILTGDTGGDFFILSLSLSADGKNGLEGKDTITDFTVGEDKIRIDTENGDERTPTALGIGFTKKYITTTEAGSTDPLKYNLIIHKTVPTTTVDIMVINDFKGDISDLDTNFENYFDIM